MTHLVFDIETVGVPWDELAPSQQEYLLRDAEKEKTEKEKEKKRAELKEWTALYPLTAKVVAIGMYDVERTQGYVYYENATEEEWADEETGFRYKGLPEPDILRRFWGIVEKIDQLISFNGRGFDVPFLMMRSAKLGIKPSRKLMGNRYDSTSHLDLLEKLTFYGSTRKFNLDFYCHGFGIKTPKSKEVSGSEVKNLYNEGKIKEIAKYCGRDIYATYQLYKIWTEYLA
ncbi:MAG: ribonuclease H-like domain-containing protein [Ignavibacteriales bacterium]|nr:MAG: 3'-5' exonuclease [Ignavibacteriaceae bacterium]MBW7872547.1 ribonuclease H-like domain-containing protein [Ignavibacteria bacterium]MCZ2141900.1 ribonuclease H-like domain-containing protein [Ignavibacteriales bacterium]OQY75842.1 MAG: 3'-5' exonuclease [Ignavibacteriales bacterium UTCHB3]MBV6445067.1 hypothetical protein [Ignavibacteriaceae bacterium]